MKTWLLTLLFASLVFAQEAPSFVEVGGIYRIQGDFTLNTALEEQDYEIEVTDISGNWIKAYVEMLDGEVWFNLDHIGVIVDIRDIDWRGREAQIDQVTACLREVATQQEIHFIDYDAYTDIDSLHEVYDPPRACSMVTLEDDGSTEDTYNIIGRIEDTAFRVTPRAGLVPLD